MAIGGCGQGSANAIHQSGKSGCLGVFMTGAPRPNKMCGSHWNEAVCPYLNLNRWSQMLRYAQTSEGVNLTQSFVHHTAPSCYESNTTEVRESWQGALVGLACFLSITSGAR